VIAGTFSETYARNAINNGFLIIECSDLVNDLKSKYGKEKLTVKTDKKVKVDFKNSSITFAGKEYAIDPVGEAAQELIIVGGLEEWVKKNL
jgi:homoaconitate hydratase